MLAQFRAIRPLVPPKKAAAAANENQVLGEKRIELYLSFIKDCAPIFCVGRQTSNDRRSDLNNEAVLRANLLILLNRLRSA
jgi:hypothetical protein